ncbi:MAG TPA: phosphoglycerate dehydrogenase [Candidatus Omnitrophica bacterium]|nr:phosphoglycerate dehydrogenase [Candidatus Omnitrophota bacterium]
MKVLISDNLSPEGIEILKSAGFEVVVKTGLKPQELAEEIKSYDGIIIRSGTKLTSEVIQAADKLKVIGRAGVGLDNVDLGTATKKGIIVMNAPSGNTISTAEHTMALILALSRNITQADTSLREGKWERKKFKGVEIYGKVLGIVGLGRIGREVAKRAMGFGMRVIAYDPYLSEETARKLEIELVDYPQLLASADYITFHVPLTEATYHMFSEKELEMVKPGVRIINCSRGGVVDENVLYKGLTENKIAGVALDVYEQEPPEESPLFKMSNTVFTPHLGASTEEAQLNVAIEIAEQVRDALLGKAIRNAVNLPSLEPEVYEEIKPYLLLAEKIGLILGQLLDGQIKTLKLKYSGEILSHDITPISSALVKGFLTPILMESVNYVNAPVIAHERGINVEEVKTTACGNFTNLIQATVFSREQENSVSGTLFTKKNPRIVEIDGYHVEAIPEGIMMIIYNMDKPGVIGYIGTTLGKRGINISGMTFGRRRPGGDAITVLNLDSEVDSETIQELLKLEHINTIKVIKL